MAKKLNSTIGVNLAFTADTDRAKRQLQDLQNQLSKIISQPMQLQINDANMTQKLREASLAAADLKVHLEKATNVDTGTLDFSKLSQSIKQSGTSLNEYADKIREIGPAGQQAFLSLAQSVASAEIPIKRSNKLVTEMWTSLKNTARWQISSSVLHGFTGALQSAYGYAEDLNESLNNIRIVTGQSIEQMADFAKEANKAAKALSTTTTEYTKASLIYYQQGLSDKEVKDRTDITIKMANAAGQNAETVSDQLTAVWNNFYDGSKSLEYYADVMTALGAATASSTEEISTGLNKFAAIAETVGLSYEYAASALATVTATTRQSADIVGTAFKTLFARIQDLELGKTLDDGTTLGKYSAALDTIGVNIKDDNDNLKEMDQILEEMAAKWNTISKDEQTALAQTVAGTRQYTQLVALMENWDFMQQNLGTSYGATGTLNEQAEIYAESWEAARDRVQASLETIYEKLLDDEFFIKLLNGLEKTITGVDKLIDSMGGLKGILSVVGVMVTKIFEKQLSQSLQDLSYNLKMLTKKGRDSFQQEKDQFLIDAIHDLDKKGEDEYVVDKTNIESMKHQLQLQYAMSQNASKMNEAELLKNKILLDQNKLLEEQTIITAKRVDLANEKFDTTLMTLRGDWLTDDPDGEKEFGAMQSRLLSDSRARVGLESLQLSNKDLKDDSTFQSVLKKAVGGKSFFKDKSNQDIKAIIEQATTQGAQDVIAKLHAMIQQGSEVELKNMYGDTKSAAEIKEITAVLDDKIKAEKEHTKAISIANQHYKETKKTISDVKGPMVTWTDILLKATNSVMNILNLINVISGITKTLTNPELSGWEKFESVTMSLVALLPMIVSTVKSLTSLFNKETIAKIANTAATWAQVKAEKALNDVKGQGGTQKVNPFKNIQQTWNEAAFAKSTKFTQQKKGGYTAQGVKGFMSKDAAVKMAGKEAFVALGTTAGAIAIIVAAIAAIAAVSKALSNANPVKKAAEAFEAAKKTASQAKEEAEKANQAYNNLKDTLNSYDESVEGLDKLIEGTEEFEQAIEKANEQALELMNTYGALGTYNTETGLWEISDSEKARVEQEAKEAKNKVQINSLTAQSRLSEATLQNQKAQIAGRDDVGFWGQMFAVDEWKNGEVGKALAQNLNIFSGVGGATVALLGQAEQNKENKQSIEAIDKLAEEYAKNGGNLEEAYKNALSDKEKELINIDDEDLRNELQKLCEATKAQTDATREYNKAIIDTTFSDNQFYAYSKNKDALNNIMAAELDAATDKLYDSTYSNAKMRDKKAQKAYAEAMGYEFVKNMNGNKGQYKDAEGNILTIDDQVARYYLAQQEALESLTDEIKKLDDTLTKIKSKGGADADLLYAIAAGGDIGDVAIGKISNGNVTNDANELANQFGLTQEQLAAIASSAGYDDLAEFMNWYTKQFYDAQEKINSLNWATGFTGSNQLLYSDAQKLNDNFSKLAFGPKGQIAASNIQTQLNDGIKQLNPEEQAAALSRLANVDFTDWDAISQVKTIMGDFGLATEYTDAQWQKLAEDMRIAAGATPDYSKLKTDLAGVASIIKDLDFGSIISDEDYEKLLAYSDAWDKYFMLQIDGTRKFIGSQSEIKKAMLDQARTERANFEERLRVQTDFLKNNISNSQKAVVTNSYQRLLKDGPTPSLKDQSSTFVNTDWQYLAGTDTTMAKRLLEDSVGQDVLEVLGYSKENVNRIIHYASQGNDKAIAELEELYNRIGEFTDENLGKTDAEMDQMLASTAESYEELKLIQDELVSKEANEIYDKQLTSIAKSSLSASENIYELAAAMNEAKRQGVDAADLEISYGDNLLRIAENYDLCAQAVEAYERAKLTGNQVIIAQTEKELEEVLKLAQANEKLKYSDAFDINRSYDHQMEKNERDLEKANRDTEDFIGANRVNAYKNVNTILAKQSDDIEKQLDKAYQRQEEAKAELNNFLADEDAPGIEDGQITDYEKYMSYLVDQRNYYDSLTKDGNTGNDAAATTWRAQYDQQIEKVNEYVEALDEADDYVIQLNKDLEENNRKQLEKTIEKFEKAQDDFDSYVDTLESYKDFMQLIGDNKALSESLNAINDINKQAFDTAKIAYEQIRDTVGSTPEQVAAAQKEMLDSMKAWTESLKEVVLNELKGFDKEFANAMLGDMTFDEMAQSLEYAQSLQEEYLTDTNKIYETNKLINEAQKQIDATTNNVAKQKLKNFIEQTKELEKQNKLSKFELDIRKAEYDVMLAEIALREAQQAKSAVRLRRDSEGNFGYVYTADANQVADAEQRLADAQNALYNVGLEGANKYAQRQVQITQEAQDAISQLTQQWINGEIESEEEYKRRVAETTDYYVEKYEEASNLLAKASMVDASIASESWAASFASQFKDLDDFEAKLNEYASKSAGAVDEYKEMLETSVGEDSDLGRAFGEATKNAKDLAAALTGGGSGESESDTTPTNDAVEDYGEKANEVVNNGGQALEDNLGDTADNADNLSNALSGGESEGGLNRALDAVNTTASKTVEVFNDLKTAIQQTVGEAYALRRHLQFMSENTFSVKYVVEQNVVSSASSYDTGGYTGQWGAAGKLAVLHEKEIVLNQDDTVNLLASIELLRGIVDTLDVQTASQMMGGILTSPGYNNNYSNPIEQNVKIEASFPAVQDRNEIEEAFNNLINKASQYANRK